MFFVVIKEIVNEIIYLEIFFLIEGVFFYNLYNKIENFVEYVFLVVERIIFGLQIGVYDLLMFQEVFLVNVGIFEFIVVLVVVMNVSEFLVVFLEEVDVLEIKEILDWVVEVLL